MQHPLKIYSLLSDVLLDKVNLINAFTGFGAYWLHLFSATQASVELVTPFITFISVLCLCMYNVIKLWRAIKNKHEK